MYKYIYIYIYIYISYYVAVTGSYRARPGQSGISGQSQVRPSYLRVFSGAINISIVMVV